MKVVAGGIAKLSLAQIISLEAGQSVTVEGEAITLADMEIRRAPKGENPNLAIHPKVSVEFDPTVTAEQVREGLAREVIRKIQQARKNADFNLDDRIRLELSCDAEIRDAVEAHRERVVNETLAREFSIVSKVSGTHTEEAEIDDVKVQIGVSVVN
jgi:isoleucyl-tRNA synthetase